MRYTWAWSWAQGPAGEAIQRELSAVPREIRDFINSRSSKPCIQDPWNYQQGSGGGLSCVWEGAAGDLLEKGYPHRHCCFAQPRQAA